MINAIGEIIDNQPMRNPPENYRLQHFDKPTQIDRKEIWPLMRKFKVKRMHTVKSYLVHCKNTGDALESLSQLKNNQPELFQ